MILRNLDNNTLQLYSTDGISTVFHTNVSLKLKVSTSYQYLGQIATLYYQAGIPLPAVTVVTTSIKHWINIFGDTEYGAASDQLSAKILKV